MSKLSVNIVEKSEEIQLFCLWTNSSDKTVSKDISKISKRYYEIIGKKEREVLPFYILSKDYNEQTKEFKLFVGGLVKNDNLDKYVLPKGSYGVIAVKPKLGFLWGLSIGEAKRYFYRQWLPKSGYKALNLEYEFHSEKSVSKAPEIEIYFAIDKKK